MLFTESIAATPQQAASSSLSELLEIALATTPVDAAARGRMPPQLSYGRHAGPAPPTARMAAVVMLLFQREGRWYLPLTERPITLSHHGGQISLPGGSVDEGESTSETALRELAEELGVTNNVRLLGRLADCYVHASDFLVAPWVAVLEGEPHWRPHDCEVQCVIELPLEALHDSQLVRQITIRRGPLEFHAPCLQIDGACVWGATSIILSELADVLRRVWATHNVL